MNLDATRFLKPLLEASWQASLVILLILLLRPLLGLRVPARWRSLLWSLVLHRLLIPAFLLPLSPTSLQNIAPSKRQLWPRAIQKCVSRCWWNCVVRDQLQMKRKRVRQTSRPCHDRLPDGGSLPSFGSQERASRQSGFSSLRPACIGACEAIAPQPTIPLSKCGYAAAIGFPSASHRFW